MLKKYKKSRVHMLCSRHVVLSIIMGCIVTKSIYENREIKIKVCVFMEVSA